MERVANRTPWEHNREVLNALFANPSLRRKLLDNKTKITTLGETRRKLVQVDAQTTLFLARDLFTTIATQENPEIVTTSGLLLSLIDYEKLDRNRFKDIFLITTKQLKKYGNEHNISVLLETGIQLVHEFPKRIGSINDVDQALRDTVIQCNNETLTHQFETLLIRMRDEILTDFKNLHPQATNKAKILEYRLNHPTAPLREIVEALDCRVGTVYSQIHELREDGYLVDSENDEQWFQTIRNIPEPSFPTAITYIRVAQGLSKVAFAKVAGISRERLGDVELGKKKPLMSQLNKIIEASDLESQGKAARLLRLLANEENRMTIKEVQECSFAALVKNLRIQRGFTQEDLAKQLGCSRDSISAIELGKMAMNQQLFGTFMQALKIPKGSALETILKQKKSSSPEPITEKELQELISETYIFTDDSPALPPEEDFILFKELRLKNSLGEKLRYLREQQGITQDAFCKIIGMSKAVLNDIELTKTLPDESSLGRIVYGLEYTIHNPIVWYLLDERKIQKKR